FQFIIWFPPKSSSSQWSSQPVTLFCCEQTVFNGKIGKHAILRLYFILNQCPLNNQCPLRHIKADRTVVCKHWLRGLCKKGDDCEFLHEYDMTKMPECYFFSKFGECMNKECPFLHIDPATKVQDCPWYDRGFCRNGKAKWRTRTINPGHCSKAVYHQIKMAMVGLEPQTTGLNHCATTTPNLE
ncbi:unnamed protein product, partial [Echinostoma caproni]|uniref:Cleavage and polyadenylation specificity factor subunit 4 n=1 Tax=Echinostoma caproni TaxID=27848 RepID=A0A183BCJ7_9TREM